MKVAKGKFQNKKSQKGPMMATKKTKPTKAYIQRILKQREPKLVENVKKLLLLRGNKSNETMNQLLTDLRMLKSPDAKMLSKKNDIHVFEDELSIEFLTQKNDASCFAVGSSTKKRPNNLILGRTFDSHILDIIELGVENFKSITEFKVKSKKAPGSKPCFMFTGDEWESNRHFMTFKNTIVDIFRGTIVKHVNLKGLDHCIVCTASNTKVLFRTYSIDFKKSTDSHPRIELEEMGPCMDLTFRRSKFASADLMKAACKKPRGLHEKKQKNVSRDNLTGDKLGQIHLGRQDVYSMQTRRVKALRSSSKELKDEKSASGATTDTEQNDE